MNKSDDLRDLLAEYLINAIKDPGSDDQGNDLKVDPRVLSVARAFIKDNPPVSVPTPDSDTGLLDELLNGGELPFSGTEG